AVDEPPDEPVERRAADEAAFAALSSSAFAGDAILTETMQLFATDPAPSPALQAFSAQEPIEPGFAGRERLREERAGLVARGARATPRRRCEGSTARRYMFPRHPSQPAISVPTSAPSTSATSSAPRAIAPSTPAASSGVLAAVVRAAAHSAITASTSPAEAQRIVIARRRRAGSRRRAPAARASVRSA